MEISRAKWVVRDGVGISLNIQKPSREKALHCQEMPYGRTCVYMEALSGPAKMSWRKKGSYSLKGMNLNPFLIL